MITAYISLPNILVKIIESLIHSTNLINDYRGSDLD